MITRKKGDTRRPGIEREIAKIVWWVTLTYEEALVDGSGPGEGDPQPLLPEPALVLLGQPVGGLLVLALAGAVPGHVTSWHVMRSCVTRDNTWTPRHSASSDTYYVSSAEMWPQTGATRTCTELFIEKTSFTLLAFLIWPCLSHIPCSDLYFYACEWALQQ